MRKKLVCVFAACLLAFSAALPVFADEQGTGFTPSVANKPAPVVDMGKTSVTIDGKVVDIGSVDSLEISVTPISKLEDAPNQEVADELKAAMDEISAKESSELKFANAADEEAFKALQKEAEDAGKTLACTNLFDLSVVDENGNKVNIDKGTFTVAVEDAENIVLVCHRKDGTWEKVDFINNGDGTITFTLNGLSPIAFFAQADAAKVVDAVVSTTESTTSSTESTTSTTESTTSTTSGTSSTSSTSSSISSSTSPKTGVESGSILLVAALITTAAGVTLVAKAKKE